MDWLVQAGESVAGAHEWIVVVDDVNHRDVERELLRHGLHPTILNTGGARMGPAVARNFGLRRSTGQWVMGLDADDVAVNFRDTLSIVEDGSLDDPTTPADWIAGLAWDINVEGEVIFQPDGEWTPFSPLVSPGEVLAAWRTTGVWPFMCQGAFLARREVWVAHGGWDLTLGMTGRGPLPVIPITQDHWGRWTNRVMMHYRKHRKSITAAERDPIHERRVLERIMRRSRAERC